MSVEDGDGEAGGGSGIAGEIADVACCLEKLCRGVGVGLATCLRGSGGDVLCAGVEDDEGGGGDGGIGGCDCC